MDEHSRSLDCRAIGEINLEKQEVTLTLACRNLFALASVEYKIERYSNSSVNPHWRIVCRSPGVGYRRDFMISAEMWEVKMWIDNLSRD